MSNNPLKDKASIGIAFTRYQMDSENGLSAFESLFADSTKLESVRAEAGYILLVDAKSKGDETKSKQLVIPLMHLIMLKTEIPHKPIPIRTTLLKLKNICKSASE